jgi:hypothetical protein
MAILSVNFNFNSTEKKVYLSGNIFIVTRATLYVC